MKAMPKPRSTVLNLALITSTITVLGGLYASAGPTLILTETFDNPTMTLGGWEANVTSVTRQYVTAGVGGSTAAQIIADLLPGGYAATMVCQNGTLVGNDLATTRNTVLTFDVKVDQPDLQYLVLGVQSWSEFYWNTFAPGLFTASRGLVPLGAYVPGQFKTISVPLNDPLWIQDPYAGPLDGPFDPSGKTYQIWFQVESGGLPTPGQVAVTIDNVRIATQNPMVPWGSVSSGAVSYDPNVGFILTQKGIAQHLGNYTETTTLNPVAWGFAGRIVITAADGAQLSGWACGTPTQLWVALDNGTRRFKGAKGSYGTTIDWTGDTSFIETTTGLISNVGFSK